MSVSPLPPQTVPAPPWEALRLRLLAQAEALGSAGDIRGSGRLRALVEEWWESQWRWNGEMVRRLRVGHDINNALVGVSGNIQLLLMGPAGQQAGIKERLEVVLREAGRIEAAARRLHELKTVFEPDPGCRGTHDAGHVANPR